MSAAGGSQSLLGDYLNLFGSTEIFIFVFMEIVTKLDTIQRVIFRKARFQDYIVFTLFFGAFSIFGTYIGTPTSMGTVSNIRDIGPMVAGLVAGPYVGLAAGLIGGIHRFFLGGFTGLGCSVATVLAGLLAGLVHRAKKGELLGVIPAILFALGIEALHSALVLTLSRPFSDAYGALLLTMPGMLIAVPLGLAICVIIIHARSEHPPLDLIGTEE